jgi:hypothetical protein
VAPVLRKRGFAADPATRSKIRKLVIDARSLKNERRGPCFFPGRAPEFVSDIAVGMKREGQKVEVCRVVSVVAHQDRALRSRGRDAIEVGDMDSDRLADLSQRRF